MDILIKKEREKATSEMNQILQAYNNLPYKSLTSSIRGELSGFDINPMRLPCVFSFLSKNEGRPVENMYYFAKGESFIKVTKKEADAIVKNKKQDDYGLIEVEESGGQLGPNDYKCYCALEQIIYKEINDNYLHFMNGAIGLEGFQEVYIGTRCQFALAALKDDSGKAYSTIGSFLKRIKKLGFTIKTGKGFNFAYKINKDEEPKAEDGFFRPFPGSTYVGVENGNQKLYLKVCNRIILNILYGGTKLQSGGLPNLLILIWTIKFCLGDRPEVQTCRLE